MNKRCLLILPALILLASCQTQDQQESFQALQTYWEAASADGILSAEELETLKALGLQVFQDAQQINWGELIGTGIGSVVASVLGVNFMRNHSLPGANRK